MILRNVVRAVVVVVDEELMIFVAYSEDVRIRWCDDKLVALSDSLVMHSSILVHVPDTSGVESVAKEMLSLEIPYGEILLIPLDFFVRHLVSIMPIFILFGCQCCGMLCHHAGTFSFELPGVPGCGTAIELLCSRSLLQR